MLVLAACAPAPSVPAPAATAPAAPAAVADRGALLHSEPGADGRTTIRYRSTSGIDGTATEVGGTVFVPPGAPPPGGWPIVTFGHGTTGVTDECAPSRHPNLLGAINAVRQVLQRGYVAVVTDYQGLGTDGPHPYLEPRSAGFNLIDAVRAARAVVPAASNRWAALGISQGGQASWAAAELAGSYGDGLDFVGSASISPPTDLTPVVPSDDRVALTVVQLMFLPVLLEGLAVLHPELDRSAYVNGVLLDERDVLLACTEPLKGRKLTVGSIVSSDNVKPRTAADRERIRSWLTELALPRERAAGPMLVLAGNRDPLVLADWTTESVAKACAKGSTVEFSVRPEGHADGRATPVALDWIGQRFGGAPARSTCAAAS